jgi:hypothetical protein
MPALFAAQVLVVLVIESITLGLIDLARWHELVQSVDHLADTGQAQHLDKLAEVVRAFEHRSARRSPWKLGGRSK